MTKTTQTMMLGLCLSGAASVQAATQPNIVYILADDLGYGDVKALNPERCKIDTPHMDQLAEQGIVFTDAHTSSSVCTPSRYGILTGRYNWRTRLQKSVLYGYGKPLIASDRLTVAGLLKEQGYNTAAIGKWHLGLDFTTTDGGEVTETFPTNIDWKGRISGGPVDVGFDSWFGISASLDMPPYVYIENDHFVGEATVRKTFMGKRFGPALPDLEAVDVLPKIGEKSTEYIQKQKADKPFFMYIALTSPHTPLKPSKEWKGKSSIGVYGDFVMQTDHIIGQIVEAVDASGLADNTIIIVTADNGCSKAAGQGKKGLASLEAKGHYPSAQFRGSKADLWDGGHRVPFIVRWPNGVKAGSESDQTICLTDLMATCAELNGAAMPETAGEDSVSFLPALKGESIKSDRAGIIHHSIDGCFAYRKGKWKLLLARGSGGWTVPRESKAKGRLAAQLYDMENDPGEKNNLYTSHPEVAKQLLQQMEADIARGRSTTGPALQNDIEDIILWKSGQK